MINAFSHNVPWADIISRYQAVARVTKGDIMRVARRWLGNDSLKIVKKFGHYPKEHVSQPGYKAVTPSHAGQQSAYAKAMMQEPAHRLVPKTVDFDHDATATALAPLVKLYTARNPMNDVYSMQIVYRMGSRSNPKARRTGFLSQPHRHANPRPPHLCPPTATLWRHTRGIVQSQQLHHHAKRSRTISYRRPATATRMAHPAQGRPQKTEANSQGGAPRAPHPFQKQCRHRQCRADIRSQGQQLQLSQEANSQGDTTIERRRPVTGFSTKYRPPRPTSSIVADSQSKPS